MALVTEGNIAAADEAFQKQNIRVVVPFAIPKDAVAGPCKACSDPVANGDVLRAPPRPQHPRNPSLSQSLGAWHQRARDVPFACLGAVPGLRASTRQTDLGGLYWNARNSIAAHAAELTNDFA